MAEAPPRRLLPSPRATAAAALGAVPGLWSGRKGHGPKVTRVQTPKEDCRDLRSADLGRSSGARPLRAPPLLHQPQGLVGLFRVWVWDPEQMLGMERREPRRPRAERWLGCLRFREEQQVCTSCQSRRQPARASCPAQTQSSGCLALHKPCPRRTTPPTQPFHEVRATEHPALSKQGKIRPRAIQWPGSHHQNGLS